MQATDLISDDQLATLTMLDCSRAQITDMTGLEYLTSLTSLKCIGNSLTELDVSQNLQLTSLDCSSNQLTNIDFGNNTQLTSLKCDTNKLTTLDVTKLSELVELTCSYNTLRTLNISQNTNLENLNCESNKQLATLDLTGLQQLTNLDCSSNSITKITGSESLPNLLTIDCDSNKLTALDVTGSTFLTDLSCERNKITELELTPLKNLLRLFLNDNFLTEIDISQNTELVTLKTSNNHLGELDVTYNTKLIYLTCISNDLTELDLSTLIDLKSLECRINNMTQLDVTHNKKLTSLICDENPLAALDVSQNTELTTLNSQSTNLTELDLSNNPKLASLSINGNQLTELDVSNNPKLTYLNCYINHIQDFSTLSKVTRLDATRQTIEMPKQTLVDNKITVNVSPDLLDQFGTPMNITPEGGGVYNQATNTITWENLTEDEGVVTYSFVSSNGKIDGKVSTPYEAPEPVKAEDVTVHYLSEDGETIAPDDVLSGNISEEYTSSPKSITGYTLKTTPANATGEFTAEAQSVTYVYTKDTEVAQPVTVNYVDTTGATIASSETITGNVGDTYNSAAKDMAGYTLTTIPVNASGVLTDEAQTVTYVYKENPVSGGQVTVDYLDDEGNKIADSEVLTGNIGDSYTLEPKIIEGYTLSASPTTETGLFTAEAHTFAYSYSKNNTRNNSTVEIRYVDEANNPISSSTELTGEVGDKYTASSKEIAGYSLKTTPANEEGIFTEEMKTVTYVYTKNTNTIKPIPKAPNKPIQITPKNNPATKDEVNSTSLPKTGDSTPWQPIFAGIVISASAWILWRKRD